MLPSHNCIIVNIVQFSRYIFESLKRLNETLNKFPHSLLQSISFLEVGGQNGLEPSTSRLSVVCSSQLSYWPISLLLGGEYRDRTGDLLLAWQALSQLS